MPARSWYDQLTPELQAEVDAEWVTRGRHMGVREFAAWLETKGVHIHYSSVSRYGSKLEERVRGLRFSTQVASALLKDSPDAEGDFATATTKVLQSEVWNVVLGLQTDDPEKAVAAIAKLSKAQSELARADVSLRRERERAAAEKRLDAELERRGTGGEFATGLREALRAAPS